MSGSGNRGGWKKRYSPEQLAKQAAKELKWRSVLEDWEQSGLDGRSYAKSKGISEHVFYSWKRTIRIRDEAQKQEQSQPTKPKSKPKRTTTKAKQPPLFLPLNMKSSGSLEIRHSSGHTLVIYDGCNPELLRQTLIALGQ